MLYGALHWFLRTLETLESVKIERWEKLVNISLTKTTECRFSRSEVALKQIIFGHF